MPWPHAIAVSNLKPGRARQVLTLTHPNAADRYRQRIAPCGVLPGSGTTSRCAKFQSCFTADLHAPPIGCGACGVDNGGDGIDRRLLDSPVMNCWTGAFTVLLVNARHVKNVSGAQVRRARLPMARSS